MRPAPRPTDAERQKRIALERQERRAQYAAMAMQGMLCRPERFESAVDAAKLAVRFADALLRELEK